MPTAILDIEDLPGDVLQEYAGRWIAFRNGGPTVEVMADHKEYRGLMAQEVVKPEYHITFVAVPLPKQLGERLRQARELNRLSLTAVAERAGMSVAYLQKLEKGLVKTPSCRHLYKLSQILGISYRSLMQLAAYPLPHEHD